MTISRRRTLIALGAITVGGGALIGTGAFTQVEATRTVNVDVAGDATAFLALIPSETTDAAEINDGVLELHFDDGLSSNGGQGLNLNAITRFDPLFTIGNNGSQDIEVYIESSQADDNAGGTISNTIEDGSSNILSIDYTFAVDAGSSAAADGHGSIVGSGNAVEVTVGDDAIVDLTIEVGPPSEGFDPSTATNFITELTITADAVEE